MNSKLIESNLMILSEAFRKMDSCRDALRVVATGVFVERKKTRETNR